MKESSGLLNHFIVHTAITSDERIVEAHFWYSAEVKKYVQFYESWDTDMKLPTDMVIQVIILFGLVKTVKTQVVYFVSCVHIHSKHWLYIRNNKHFFPLNVKLQTILIMFSNE